MRPQDRELMQQALEALEALVARAGSSRHWTMGIRQSLRARLAEPDDEPVACDECVTEDGCMKRNACLRTDKPLYTRPAARTVQPLTPSQVHELCQECYLDWHRGWSIDEEPNRYLLLARAIERFHGITGDSHD